jgi:hypothetical protein
MKKTLLIFSVILMMSGCTSSAPETIESTPEAEVSIEEGWEMYTDTTLGIQFEYPSAWGPITVQDEMGIALSSFNQEAGLTSDDMIRDEDGEVIYDGIYNRSLSFSGLGGTRTFLVANNDDVGILGRGGYWGDRSSGFDTDDGVERYCDESEDCETFTNENGVSIAHVFYAESDSYGEILTDIDEYAVTHSGHLFGGLVISSQFLGSEYALDLRLVVDSLKFYR